MANVKDATPLQKIAGPILTCAASVAGFYHVFLTFVYYIFDTSNIAFYNARLMLLGIVAACAVVYVAAALISKTNRAEVMKGKILGFFCWEQVLLILLGVLYIVSMVSMNRIYVGDWIRANQGGLIDGGVSILILFPLGRQLAKDDHRLFRKIAMNVTHVLVLGLAVLLGWVTVQILQEKTVLLPRGAIYMNDNMRLILNSNPNTGSMYIAVFLIVAVCMLIWAKPVWLRILYALSAIVFYINVTLTNSRATYVSVMMAFAAIAAVSAYTYVRGSKRIRLFISIASFAAVVFLMSVMRDGTFSFYKWCIRKEGSNKEKKMEIFADGFNGRFDIWLRSLKIMVQDMRTFFIGVSHAGSQVFLGAETFYSHNQFIEMGLCYGIFGFIAFTAWMALIARDSIRLQIPKNGTVTLGAKIIPALVLAMTLNNLAEAMLLYYGFFSGSVFVFFCGMTAGKAEGLRMRPVKQVWNSVFHNA